MLLEDGSIFCREAKGWLTADDVKQDPRITDFAVELDLNRIDERRQRLLQELESLDEFSAAGAMLMLPRSEAAPVPENLVKKLERTINMLDITPGSKALCVIDQIISFLDLEPDESRSARSRFGQTLEAHGRHLAVRLRNEVDDYIISSESEAKR